jgi:hypothetical protein
VFAVARRNTPLCGARCVAQPDRQTGGLQQMLTSDAAKPPPIPVQPTPEDRLGYVLHVRPIFHSLKYSKWSRRQGPLGEG